MRIAVEKWARQTLRDLRDRKARDRLESAIDELEAHGFDASNIKTVSSSANMYRKRVGRYRMLFTLEKEPRAIHIWIIEIKKSPRDYDKWIKKIKGVS